MQRVMYNGWAFQHQLHGCPGSQCLINWVLGLSFMMLNIGLLNWILAGERFVRTSNLLNVIFFWVLNMSLCLKAKWCTRGLVLPHMRRRWSVDQGLEQNCRPRLACLGYALVPWHIVEISVKNFFWWVSDQVCGQWSVFRMEMSNNDNVVITTARQRHEETCRVVTEELDFAQSLSGFRDSNTSTDGGSRMDIWWWQVLVPSDHSTWLWIWISFQYNHLDTASKQSIFSPRSTK